MIALDAVRPFFRIVISFKLVTGAEFFAKTGIRHPGIRQLAASDRPSGLNDSIGAGKLIAPIGVQ